MQWVWYFKAADTKPAYIMGDTVDGRCKQSIEPLQTRLSDYGTRATLISGISDGIIMGTADVLKTSQVMPKAKIITVHMDTVNHTAVQPHRYA